MSQIQKDIVDATLVSKILDGDIDSFATLMEKYEKKIHRYCMRMLNFNTADADDAAVQTFTKAYTKIASFNPKLSFSSWLYRIAHNESVNIIRKNSSTFSFSLDWLQEKGFDAKADIDFSIEKPDIEAILQTLSVNDRQILTLFYLEELSLQEIGEILKCTPNNVAVKLNRARNKARKQTQSTHKL